MYRPQLEELKLSEWNYYGYDEKNIGRNNFPLYEDHRNGGIKGGKQIVFWR